MHARNAIGPNLGSYNATENVFPSQHVKYGAEWGSRLGKQASSSDNFECIMYSTDRKVKDSVHKITFKVNSRVRVRPNSMHKITLKMNFKKDAWK